MDFGVLYEIEIPKPWTDRSEIDAYRQVFAQVELAEEMGFSHFWTVEHHFLTEFSHCSAKVMDSIRLFGKHVIPYFQ